MTPPSETSLERCEERLAASVAAFYDLTLFVSGASDLAARAIADAKQLCETYLVGHYRLSVIDVHDVVAGLCVSEVLATPTLVKNLPTPVRRVVGDLSRADRVLRGLDLPIALVAASANR